MRVTAAIRRLLATREFELVQPQVSLMESAQKLLDQNLTSLAEIERVIGRSA
jgi:hypothetical protein